jgi:hypothetical protein
MQRLYYERPKNPNLERFPLSRQAGEGGRG